MRPSQLELYIPHSSDYEKTATSTPERAMLLVEAQSVNIIPLQSSGKNFSSSQTSSSAVYTHGQQHDNPFDLILRSSPVIRWVTYPIVFPLLDQDDQAKFAELLVQRYEFMHDGNYPNWYLHIVDLAQLLDLVRRYASDALTQPLISLFKK